MPISGRPLNSKKFSTGKKLEEPGPGEEDLSGVSFFILTNDEDIEPAIKSRLTEYKFPDLDAQSHANARDKQIAAFISQYRKINDSSPRPEQAKAFINAVLDNTEIEIERYKDLMLELNKDPGARTIQLFAAQTIDLIFTTKLWNENPNYEVPTESVKKLIARYSKAVNGELRETKDEKTSAIASSDKDKGNNVKIRSMLDV